MWIVELALTTQENGMVLYVVVHVSFSRIDGRRSVRNSLSRIDSILTCGM